MKKGLILLLMLILISGLVVAKDDSTESDTVHLRAGHLRYVEDEIKLSKGVTIIKEKNTITAPRGKVYKKENKAILNGGIVLEHDKDTVKSKEMVAWLDKDEYIFKDSVKLNRQDEKGKNLQLETSYLEMSLDDNSFQTDKGIVMYYDKKVIEAQKAKYNDQDETLKLKKNVLVKEENGDWTKGNKAVFYLGSDKEEFIMDGDVEIEIGISDNEGKQEK